MLSSYKLFKCGVSAQQPCYFALKFIDLTGKINDDVISLKISLTGAKLLKDACCGLVKYYCFENYRCFKFQA